LVVSCHIFHLFFFFFFSSRRRHTRSKRDWSSDVCSSDLPLCGATAGRGLEPSPIRTRGWNLPTSGPPQNAESYSESTLATLEGRSEERRVGKDVQYRLGGRL